MHHLIKSTPNESSAMTAIGGLPKRGDHQGVGDVRLNVQIALYVWNTETSADLKFYFSCTLGPNI